MEIYRPSLQNRELLAKYLRHNSYRGCELSLANPILWGEHYNTGFVVIDDMLVYCTLEENVPTAFSFPVGAGDKKHAFDAVVEYFDKNGRMFCMYMIHPEMFALIEHWYPGMYTVEYDRDNADYLYETKTLAELAGKKLHGKRNHINRFLENYPDYIYEPIDDGNEQDCLKIAYDWARDNMEPESDASGHKSYESCALQFALTHRQALNLRGALIRVEQRAVAFTLGGPLTEDTFDIHFEKAYADIQGAYAMINREFVRRELSAYQYVNREEDMGIPGLRRAKTSYRPIGLVEKGTVRRK